MNRNIIALVLILLTGCATERPSYVAEPAPPPGESLIYVYRPPATSMEGLTAVVELDGTKVAELRSNGYTVMHVREGDHVVSQYWKNMTFTEHNRPLRNRTDLPIHTVAGIRYYFRVLVSGDVGTEGVSQVVQVGWTFDRVSSQTAEAEIKKCKREMPK
jgi:hypothetical protein